MKHSLLFTLPVLTLATACLPALANEAPQTEIRDVGTFDAVQVSGAVQVHVEHGDKPRVQVRAAPEVLAQLQTEVSEGTLHVQSKGRLFNPGRVELFIVTPDLKRIEVSGAVKGNVTGLKREAFEVKASGASELTLAGEVKRLSCSLSGASELHALGLTAHTADIDASGASHLKVHAAEVLRVEASGATRVRYAGRPKQVHRNLSGASDCAPI